MTATQPARPAGGGALSLSRSWNGLPIWAWVGIGGVSAGGVYIFAKRYRASKAATTPAAGAANGTTGPTTDYPLVIPLPGPPGQSVVGPAGPSGAPGVAGPTGPPGTPDRPIVVPSVPPAPPPVWSPPPPAPPPPPPAPPPIPTVIVARGDSLWKIAQRVYGNGALWPKIWAWNRDIIGDNPNIIQPGWELGVPP